MRSPKFLLCTILTAIVCADCTSWQSSLTEPAAQPALEEVRLPYRRALDEYVAGLRQREETLSHETVAEARPEKALQVARALAATLIRATDAARASLQATTRPITVLEELKNERNRARRSAENGLGADAVSRAALIRPLKSLLEDEDDRLWQEVGTILIEKSQPWLEQRANLFGRKYFHDPEDSGGNIVEAWMNSSFDVFRSARIGEPRFEASQGVSPWEATARLEPFVKLQEGNEIGIVGGLGTTYHLFPDHDGREDWQSRWVQRVGVRAGVGFLQQSGETGDFVFGGAVQIRSLTVWAMYDPEERDVFLAVGSGDSRWLGELTTWFD